MQKFELKNRIRKEGKSWKMNENGSTKEEKRNEK